jgi:exopolysaccharide/PEP-CTERM locus tyrosine autokinase
MSKIEKALHRARNEKGLVVVDSKKRTGEPDQVSSQSRDLVMPKNTAAEPKSRADSAAAIALMHEPSLRDKSDLTLQRIIHPEMAENSTVKAFRDIRTQILQKTQGQNAIIMVTSVTVDSGSTFVTTNLGVAFAFDAGKTALLVDCNLRKPGLQRLIPGSAPLGITDYLEKEDLDIAGIIHPIGIERLRVIPAGGQREIPSEYFTSTRMKQMLHSIRQRYAERFIFLDAPPMSETADTQILAELCDYIVLVVPYGKVTNGQVETCIKSLDNKKLLGVVFNNEPNLPNLDWKKLWRTPFEPLLDWLFRLTRTTRNAAQRK